MATKAKWTESRYGSYFLHLPNSFMITVEWDNGGYKVSFGHLTLKARFQDLNEAKRKGEELVKRVLTQVLAVL